MPDRGDSLLLRRETLNGRYELVEIIGKGGFAMVYKAHDLNMGVDVAIKVLKKKWSANNEYRRRFLQESRHHATLKHPRIVPVTDRGTTQENRLYFVLDLLHGQSLDEFLKANPEPLPWDEVIPIIIQVCEGLGFAHRQRVIHRDIKPGNIFLEDREHLSVKILDLGIAKELPEEASDEEPITELTDLRKGGAPCTPEYMAPEQALHSPASPHTDIYALGVMMYLMLTGSLPFRPPSGLRGNARHSALGTMHIRDLVEPLRERCPEAQIPQLVEGIVMQMLAKRPEERFNSARDLSDALLFAQRRLVEFSHRGALSGHRRERRLIRFAAGFSGLTTAVSIFLLLLLVEIPGLRSCAVWIKTPGQATNPDPGVTITQVPAPPRPATRPRPQQASKNNLSPPPPKAKDPISDVVESEPANKPANEPAEIVKPPQESQPTDIKPAPPSPASLFKRLVSSSRRKTEKGCASRLRSEWQFEISITKKSDTFTVKPLDSLEPSRSAKCALSSLRKVRVAKSIRAGAPLKRTVTLRI